MQRWDEQYPVWVFTLSFIALFFIVFRSNDFWLHLVGVTTNIFLRYTMTFTTELLPFSNPLNYRLLFNNSYLCWLQSDVYVNVNPNP